MNRTGAALLVAVGLALMVFAVHQADAHHGAVSTAEWLADVEGMRLTPYPDAGGYSVCVGHQLPADADLTRRYTHAECLDLLEDDLERFRTAVRRFVEPDPEGAQETALISLAYNIGAGAFGRSRLVTLINWNADEWEVTLEWLSWDHAHVNGRKQVVEGLLERRRREVALYYGGAE